MRIVIPNHEFPPVGAGAATATKELAAGIARHGHQVTVLTAAFSGLPRAESLDGYTVRRLPALRTSAHRSTPAEMLSFAVLGLAPALLVRLKAHPTDLDGSQAAMIWLESRWERYYRRYRGKRHYLTLTPVQAALSQELISVTQRYLSGRVLDAGAGGLTYAFLLMPRALEYISIDIDRTHPSLDIQGDVEQLPFADDSIDTVFCSQVLEHVAKPWRVMREFSRVLRPGGNLLVTVPHLAYLHGLPHDYFRYTNFGLATLAEGTMMTATEIRPAGGLLCFLAEPLAIAGSAFLGGVPGLPWPTWLLGAAFARTVTAIDRYAGFRSRYPVNWVGVFAKASAEEVEGNGECGSPS